MFNRLKALFFFFLIPASFAFTACHWADLPEGNFQDILSNDSPNCARLNSLVESYHREPKDCPIAAGIRIAKLMEIRDFLKDWMEEEPSNKALASLHERVESKYQYLRSIMRLYLRGKTSFARMKEYHDPLNDQADFAPLCLSNDIAYSLSNGEYQGAHWIESIDPCHRVLGNYYKKWLGLKENKKACPWFFLWLETQNVPVNTPSIRYLRTWEMNDSQILIDQGKLCDYVTAEPLDGTYLCVVDQKNRVFIHSIEEGVFLTSFTQGRPVKAAGFIDCENGVVTKLSYDHERYVPTTPEHYFQLAHSLFENSIPMASNVILHFQSHHINYEIAIHSSNMDDKDTFLKETIKLIGY